MSPRIYMVDDEEDLVWTVTRHIERERPDWDFHGYSNPIDALQAINSEPPDLLITDIHMPSLDGLELVLVARQRVRDLRVLLISAYGSSAARQQADRLGRVDFLEKPFDHRELIQRVERGLETDSQFSGEIALPLLSDLIQIVALSRETCALAVLRGGEKGTVWFHRGQIEHCEVGELEGQEAFRQLMSWGEGEFRIRQGEEPPTRSIVDPTDQLLLDSLRLLDEHAAGVEPAGAAAEKPATGDSVLDRAVMRWQQRSGALRLESHSTVIALSLADGRSLVLHGPRRGLMAESIRESLAGLVAKAGALRESAASGTVESVEPGLGWTASWSHPLDLAVIYAQPLANPPRLGRLRARSAAVGNALGVADHG